MPTYVIYSSEDEGFRFPIGKTSKSMKNVMKKAKRYINNRTRFGSNPTVITNLTDQQIENSCPPACHGKVVKMFCLDGDEYQDKLNDVDKGFAYDWLYIIRQ